MNRLQVRAALATLTLLCGSAYAAEPTCTNDPSESLKRTVVEFERMFDKDEVYVENYKMIKGIIGSAWYLNSTTLVTIGHVPQAAKLSSDWKKVTLSWSDARNTKVSHSEEVNVRIKDTIAGRGELEPIFTLELERAISGAQIARVRERPLMRNEAVVAVAYNEGEMRFAQGRFALPDAQAQSSDNSGKPPPDYLPFEMVDRDRNAPVGDRLALDHGTSGAPIFDCNGEVAAVVQNLLTRPYAGMGKMVRIPTPWGQANVTAAPAAPLLYLE